MNILIINGPNLNLLGKRQPHLYGTQSFEEYLIHLQQTHPQHTIRYYQSNVEGFLIDCLHHNGFGSEYTAIILNAGAYTHTSIALADAIVAIETPVVEVHISDIYAREPFRHHSYLKPHCITSIVGQGLDGYRQAIQYIQQQV